MAHQRGQGRFSFLLSANKSGWVPRPPLAVALPASGRPPVARARRATIAAYLHISLRNVVRPVDNFFSFFIFFFSSINFSPHFSSFYIFFISFGIILGHLRPVRRQVLKPRVLSGQPPVRLGDVTNWIKNDWFSPFKRNLKAEWDQMIKNYAFHFSFIWLQLMQNEINHHFYVVFDWSDEDEWKKVE